MVEYRRTVEEYRNQVTALRQQYLDYPSFVTIETQALCNAACDFCPYPVLQRQGALLHKDGGCQQLLFAHS